MRVSLIVLLAAAAVSCASPILNPQSDIAQLEQHDAHDKREPQAGNRNGQQDYIKREPQAGNRHGQQNYIKREPQAGNRHGQQNYIKREPQAGNRHGQQNYI
ncbi:hypothetical protein V8C40DRAFT_253263 [Trichoderma camerunense]